MRRIMQLVLVETRSLTRSAAIDPLIQLIIVKLIPILCLLLKRAQINSTNSLILKISMKSFSERQQQRQSVRKVRSGTEHQMKACG